MANNSNNDTYNFDNTPTCDDIPHVWFASYCPTDNHRFSRDYSELAELLWKKLFGEPNDKIEKLSAELLNEIQKHLSTRRETGRVFRAETLTPFVFQSELVEILVMDLLRLFRIGGQKKVLVCTYDLGFIKAGRHFTIHPGFYESSDSHEAIAEWVCGEMERRGTHVSYYTTDDGIVFTRIIFSNQQIEDCISKILSHASLPVSKEEVEAFTKDRSVFFSFIGENVQADLVNAQYLDRNYTVQQGKQDLELFQKCQEKLSRELSQLQESSRLHRFLKRKRILELQKELQGVQAKIENLSKRLDAAAMQLKKASANASAYAKAEADYSRMRGQLYEKLVAWRKSYASGGNDTVNCDIVADYTDAARDMQLMLHDFLFIEEILKNIRKHFANGGLWVILDRNLMKQLTKLSFSQLSVHRFLDGGNGTHLVTARNLANQIDRSLLVKMMRDGRLDGDVLIYSKDWNGKF